MYGTETRAERDARVLNSLRINQNAGFYAEAVGIDRTILKTPFAAQPVYREEARAAMYDAFIKDRRFIGDFHISNFGIYNGKTVAFDPGFTVQAIPRRMSIRSAEIIEKHRKWLTNSWKLAQYRNAILKRFNPGFL